MVSDSGHGQMRSWRVNHMHVKTTDRAIKRIQDITNKTRTLFSPVAYVAHNLYRIWASHALISDCHGPWPFPPLISLI